MSSQALGIISKLFFASNESAFITYRYRVMVSSLLRQYRKKTFNHFITSIQIHAFLQKQTIKLHHYNNKYPENLILFESLQQFLLYGNVALFT